MKLHACKTLIVVALIVNTSYCETIDNDVIGKLKWADGVIAAVLSLLWAARQMLLTLMYNGVCLTHIKTLYYANVVASTVLLMGTVAFIIVASVLTFPKDAAYPNTLVVFVGFIISVVLDKRKQFDICRRTRLISLMMNKDKFRVGELALGKPTHKHPTGLFKISRRRMPKGSKTNNAKWSGLKYEKEGLLYIEDWGIEHRIYGISPEDLVKHMGKYGSWRDALLEASLYVGWLPSYYINDNLLKYLKDYADNSNSIKDSIPTWKGQAVGLQNVDKPPNCNMLSKKIIGYYALAIMEEPDTARQWIIDWSEALEKMHKTNCIYSGSTAGNISDLTASEDIENPAAKVVKNKDGPVDTTGNREGFEAQLQHVIQSSSRFPQGHVPRAAVRLPHADGESSRSSTITCTSTTPRSGGACATVAAPGSALIP